MEARRLALAGLRHLYRPGVLQSRPPSVPQTEVVVGLMTSVRSFSSASSSSSSSSSSASSPSWFQRIKKGLFGGQEHGPSPDQEIASRPAPVAERMDDLSLHKFADELRKAQTFGKLTQFGRGLPRGGEAIAARSLQRQEEILRKLATYSPDGQHLGAKHKSEVAAQCGCTVKDVNDVLGKYEWAREANARMMRLKAEGKPLPKSLDEVEKMMGSRWKAAASVNLSKDGETSRNSPCPCGSGKKYKRCCGKS